MAGNEHSINYSRTRHEETEALTAASIPQGSGYPHIILSIALANDTGPASSREGTPLPDPVHEGWAALNTFREESRTFSMPPKSDILERSTTVTGVDTDRAIRIDSEAQSKD